jgi:hypothetical protein
MMLYRWTGFMLLALLVLGFVPVAPAAARPAASEPLCFVQTGECIAGPIRTYWERNGGLPVFGYPITPLRVETVDSGWTGPVQWFERDRLEDHGPHGVLAGRLGARLLELQGRPWETLARVSPAQVPPSCIYFAETGHSLCEPFLTSWRAGGGLERFGFPISEPMLETIGGWTGTVQYFERRRMELHTEIVGIPVLLGLLGTEVLNGTPAAPEAPEEPGTPEAPVPPAGPTPECVEQRLPRVAHDRTLLRDAYEQVTFRSVLGCPVAYLENRPAAVQRLERGQMLWVDMGYGLTGAAASLAGQRFIYTIANPGPLYYRFVDTWVAGIDPMRYDLPAPDGLYPPWGGFGKLWIQDSNVRNGLGWAIEPRAHEGEADIVIFDNIYNDPNNLGALILFEDTNTVYAFGRLDQPEEVQIIYP